jgi:hypothetical protein
MATVTKRRVAAYQSARAGWCKKWELPKWSKFKTIRAYLARKIGEAAQWPTRIFGIG